jgi:plastocyanin
MVNQGDSVVLTIHDNDTEFSPHTFTITQAPYTSVDTGNMSPGQVKTLPTFTASASGSFHYQCNFHPTTMKGTFQVNPVSSSPITPVSLLALIGTATAAVFITVRKRR